MREIILDTETTGLDPAAGDRIVEIGCVEILNKISTGKTFHVYLNPERDMPAEAFRVHGLSARFLSDKPLFRAVMHDFLAFLGDARLVIHNAEFDMRFLNAELLREKQEILTMGRVTDTLSLARRKHPGAPASLDALCARYRIDRTRRVKHGALLDAEILAEVYVELSGGKQTALQLVTQKKERLAVVRSQPARRAELLPRLFREHASRHADFVAALGIRAVWQVYPKKPQ